MSEYKKTMVIQFNSDTEWMLKHRPEIEELHKVEEPHRIDIVSLASFDDILGYVDDLREQFKYAEIVGYWRYYAEDPVEPDRHNAYIRVILGEEYSGRPYCFSCVIE